MNTTYIFWSACGGGLLVMILTRILPGGGQGVLTLFSALVISTTVVLSTRYIVRAVTRLIRPRENGFSSPERPLPPPIRSSEGRRIDPP